MSVAASPLATTRVARFYDSTVGKKAVMAISGMILVGFVIVHLLGNLQFYLGEERLNAYGAALRSLGELLWIARAILLVAVILHIVSALQLWGHNRTARPVAYKKLTAVTSNYTSRTMLITGLATGLFVIYHLYNLTLGPQLQHDPVTGNPLVYQNVIAAFSDPIAVVIYVVAMGFLGSHLVHGVWSMFQSVGFNHPKYTPMLRTLATVLAALIVLGNISIPLAVLAHLY